MMRKIKSRSKVILALLFTFIALMGQSIKLYATQTYSYASYVTQTNSDTGYQLIIDDTAGYFVKTSDAEFTELITTMQSISAYCNILLVTTTSHSFFSTRSFAENYYETECGYGSNGVIFVIDRDLDQIYLVSEGRAQKYISNTRANVITDNTYIYATKSRGYDYYTCALKTMQQVHAVFNGQKILSPMKYITNALMAIVLGIIFNYFLARWLSKPHRPKRDRLLTAVFHDFRIDNPNSRFLTKSKRYSPHSSGSGGSSGGGGGGGGGGGSSGGGHGI